MAQKNEMTYDECIATLKQKYDGYHFHKTQAEDVYNPFSLIKAMSAKEFGDYWFVTGTPTFLVKMLKVMRIDAAKFANGIEVDGRTFESYHIDTTSPEPLLYQSGYLTIKGYEPRGRRYTLGLPNDEVKYGFFYELLPFYVQGDEAKEHFDAWKFSEDVRAGNVDGFMKRAQAIFASLESGMDAAIYPSKNNCEFSKENSNWKNDMEVIFPIAFQADGRKVLKIGAVFSSTEKNITAWKCVTAE